jgi:hypothetical protein
MDKYGKIYSKSLHHMAANSEHSNNMGDLMRQITTLEKCSEEANTSTI